MSKHSVVLCVMLLSATCVRIAPAQSPTRPTLEWRTTRTEHFTIHYPTRLADWTRVMASHLESVRTAVSAVAGSAPAARVTVLVDNPYSSSNGFAFPFIDHPLIVLWPTPPTPSSTVGDHRGWGEMLSVHEYTHIAHLTRPSRNPTRRWLARLLPVRLGPIAVKAPRWVDEGYATYVEGTLTGSGRPHGAWRAAILRTWALHGTLPTYAQLNGSSAYEGGAMAYLAGSAFLEWLAGRQGGEKSLVHLWLRLSARVNRRFDDAFAGVFGGLPEDLYGRFTAELTGKALAADSLLRQGGMVSGHMVQALDWHTGHPAVSPNGALVALVLRSRTEPGRVVVWRTTPEPVSARARRERARQRALDPLDVPAIPWRPRPKTAVATLYAVDGVSYEHPRFLPDGTHVLVTRLESLGDGTLRPDLYVWDMVHGDVRRVTHGAAVRTADPSPDGHEAVADRCLHGTCDLVRVDLRTGRVTLLATGSPTVSYYGPRYAPDGRSIVVSVHEDGRWRVVVMGRDGQAPHEVGPDDGANRYDAAFVRDGRSLVLISDAGGIPNVARLDLATGAVRPLTRVPSAALAPEPDAADGSLYFLQLSPKGLDLMRLWPDSVHVGPVVTLPPTLAPAAPLAPVAADTFARAPLPPPQPYGLGPRRYRVLPTVSIAPEGRRLGVTLASTDPVGRFTWLLQGSYGDRGTWRGASASAAVRAVSPVLSGELFTTQDTPSAQHAGRFAPPTLDATYTGGAVYAELDRRFVASSHRVRLGASLGVLHAPALGRGQRRLVFADYAGAHLERRRQWLFIGRVAAHGAVGRTTGRGWRRAVGTVGLEVRRSGYGLAGQFTAGRVNGSALPFEQFAAGGVEPPLFDAALLSQRVAIPAFPVGIAMGRTIGVFRAELTGAMLRPYYLGVSAGDALGRWHRAVGVDLRLPLAPIPFVALPAVHLAGGVAYSLDAPFRKKTRGYLSLVYRP